VLTLSSAARACQNELAVLHPRGGHTYGELLHRIDPLLEPLAAFPPGPVAFVAEPTLSNLLLLYALFEVGRPAFPLNPRLLEHEREDLRRRADAHLVRMEGGFPRLVAAGAGTAVGGQLLIATSGSTGTPRIVELSEEALVTAAESSQRNLGWKLADRWLLTVGLSHIGGAAIVVRCLLARRPVVLPAPQVPLWDWIVESKSTLVSLVPTQVERLLPFARSPGSTALRAVLVGGAHAPARLVRRGRRRGLPILLTYGMSEAGSQIATQPPSDLHQASEHRLTDVGFVLPNLELCTTAEQLAVRGPALFSGYVGEPTPFDADGWFDTGDLGQQNDDGRLRVFGRRKDRIISGGENVAPREIELVLESHPEVERAVVIGLPHPLWGEEVAAAILAGRAGPRLFDELRELAGTRLASFKRPRVLTLLPELPLLPSDKIDLAAVKRALQRVRVM